MLEVDSKGVITATGSLEEFSKAAKKSEQAASKAGGIFREFGKHIGWIANPVTATIGALVALKKTVIDFTKSSIQAFGEYEMIKSNLSVVLGSAELAAETFEKLKVMGAKTPFEVGGLTEAAIQLKQTGTALKDIIPVLSMLGDAAGGSNEKFGRIVANYAQIQSVGHASSIDTKQFAQMGLPIYEVFKKMGVTGTATAEQVREAFRIMTSEGGTFFNGMAIGAKTLEGKVSTLKDTWKDFKATFADTSGLGEAWKKLLDDLTASIQAQTDTMAENKRVRDALEAYKAGNATDEQKLIYLAKQENALILERSEYINSIARTGRSASNFTASQIKAVNEYTEKIKNVRSEQEKLQKTVNANNTRKSAVEQALADVQATAKTFDDAIGQLNAKYGQTDAAKREEILKQIEYYKNLLTLKKQVVYQDSRGYDRVKEVGVSDGQREKIQVVLQMLQRELEQIDGKLLKGKKTWREYFKEVTGQEVLKTENGVQAAEKYLAFLQAQEVQKKELKNLLGEKWDIGDDVEQITHNLTELHKVINELLSGKDLDAPFTRADRSVTTLRAEIEKYQEDLKSARSKQVSSEYQKQISLLKMTTEEREKAALIEKGVLVTEVDKTYELKKQLEYLQAQDKIQWRISEAKQKAIDSGKKGDFAAAVTAEAAYQGIQGTDVGTFVQSLEKTGSPEMAAIETLIKAFVDMAKASENVMKILDFAHTLLEPIVAVLMPLLDTYLQMFVTILDTYGKTVAQVISVFSSLLQLLYSFYNIVLPFLLIQLQVIGQAFQWLNDYAIVPFGNIVINAVNVLVRMINHSLGFLGIRIKEIKKLQTVEELLNKEKQNELDRLKALNNQYLRLKDAIREQEEYYLKKRRNLNALYLNETVADRIKGVNDLIITPQGKFSTHPDDYIIAAKNPAELGRSSVAVFVNIQNTASDTVAVQAKEKQGVNGQTELLIMISKKIAADYAVGDNGWDGAFDARVRRTQGRRLTT